MAQNRKYMLELVKDEAKTKLKDYTLKLLANTRIPVGAFVAIEIPKRHTSKAEGGAFEVTFGKTGICVLNVEDQPDQQNHIYHLTENRGCRIICYGNFPTLNNSSRQRQKKYQQYTDPATDANPWDDMATRLDRHILDAPLPSEERSGYKEAIDRKNEEIEQLKKELEAHANKQADSSNNSSSPERSKQTRTRSKGKTDRGNEAQLGLPETAKTGA